MPDLDEIKSSGLTYKDAGVDIDAGNALVEAIKPLAKSTARPGTDSALGGFGGLFDLKAAGYQDPILVAANDGVGTKLKLAIESGKHDTIGIDLVAMCVNDLIVQGAEPLFFLDYFACGRLDQDVAQNVIAGIAEGCRLAGAALIGGETAEMPGLYRDGDYDLAGFAVGAAERGRLLPSNTIEAGDQLIGIASSGAHSNGFSLIRKLVSNLGLDWAEQAPFMPGSTLIEAFLTPTRIYVKPLLGAFKSPNVPKALAHITGGGLTENLPRVLPAHLGAQIDLAAWKTPLLFDWIATEGNIAPDDLIRTFNCGLGMIAVTGANEAEALVAHLQNEGETATLIGKIVVHAETKGRVGFSGRLEFSS